MLLLVAGGLFGGILEAEGAHRQDEVHHCVTCCTTHHTATAEVGAHRQILMSPDLMAVPLGSSNLYTELVIRLLDPPPKFLV